MDKILSAVMGGFWIAAYILSIIHYAIYRRHVFPGIAIALNMGWELAAVYELHNLLLIV